MMASRFVEFGNFCFRRRGLMLPIALVLLILPSPALSDNPVRTGVLGLVFGLLGQLIRIVTIGLQYIIRGGKDHHVYAEGLVTTGCYAHTRNPMYLGNLLLLVGLAVASNSWVFMIGGLVVSILMHGAIIAAEEDYLRSKFGAEFDAYCARVPRFLPSLAGIASTMRRTRFDWRRVLTNEYSGPIDWLSATAIIALINIWRADGITDHPVIVAALLLVVAGRLMAWLSARATMRARLADAAGRSR